MAAEKLPGHLEGIARRTGGKFQAVTEIDS
jgi:hypothetical protein